MVLDEKELTYILSTESSIGYFLGYSDESAFVAREMPRLREPFHRVGNTLQALKCIDSAISEYFKDTRRKANKTYARFVFMRFKRELLAGRIVNLEVLATYFATNFFRTASEEE